MGAFGQTPGSTELQLKALASVRYSCVPKGSSGLDEWGSTGKPWETPLEDGESTGKTTGKADLNHEI